MTRDVADPPLFSVRTTLLLFAVLVGPLLMSLVAHIEPYPAIVMPGGGQVQRATNGRTTFSATEVVGFDAAGDERTVAAGDFLRPIPRHYMRPLMGIRFGIEDKPARQVRVRGLGSYRVARVQATPAERTAAKAWLRSHLEHLGLESDTFIIRTLRIHADAATGAILEREVVDEVVFDLSA